MTREVVLITGGTSGIGAAFARYFAEKGFDLIITGRPGDKIYPCVKNLSEKHHVNVDIILAELSKPEDVLRIEEIIRENYRIEILINNAGFGLPNLFWKEDINSLENMIKVHINAPLRFIYAALPNMMKKRKGIIINVSSLASFLPIPRDSVYSATKLFQNSLMESLHISLKEKGIKLQVLCPGFVKTDFHKNISGDPAEMKKREIFPWMQPDEVVKISIKNLSRKNKVIIIPGLTCKILKFVYTILPYPVYYQIANKYLS
jgi:short-subunit dehydrogenase